MISVAISQFSFWAFLAMLSQFLIIWMEKSLAKIFKHRDTLIGNFSFWASFCIVGQPTLILCYYIDYISKSGLGSLKVLAAPVTA